MFSHRLATVCACQPIRLRGVPGAARRGIPGVPPGQVRLEPRGQDQPVGAGQRGAVAGAGHRGLPGPGPLLAGVGQVIQAGQPRPQRVAVQHAGQGDFGVPLLQRHLQPRRQVDPEPPVAQQAQHPGAAVVMQPPPAVVVAEAAGGADRPRSAAGSTAEQSGERPNVNGSPGRTPRSAPHTSRSAAPAGPSSQGHGRFTAPARQQGRPGPAEQQRRIRRAPGWPVIRRGGPGGAGAAASRQPAWAAPSGSRPGGAIGLAPTADAMCPPGAARASCPAGSPAPARRCRLIRPARPGGKERRDLRAAGGVPPRYGGQGQMAAPLARSWGGLPISASAGPPARS